MKKAELVKVIAENTGVSQVKVNEVIDEFTRQIVNVCRDDAEDVSIPGFGTFKQKATAAHKGRNPLSGETIDIKGSRTIGFRPMPGVKVIEEPKKKAKK